MLMLQSRNKNTSDSLELQNWLAQIAQLHPQEIELGLDRVRSVAARLNVLDLNCRIVTVTGTNGKGSCVRYLETITHLAGLHVGAYSSPHLLRFAERIRINTHSVADEAICAALAAVENALEGTSLTYFEYTTLAAFYLFKQAGLDLIILEVGLGGRLDAVNILDCEIAVITGIGIDHTEWLGHTREAIAAEKAGIFRPHKPAVVGDMQVPATIEMIATTQSVPLFCVGKQFTYQVGNATWQWQSINSSYVDLPMPRLPIENAATALMVVELLKAYFPIAEGAIREGLRQADLWGRFSCWSSETPIYLDVAHNPAAAKWLVQRLKQEQKAKGFKRVYAVVAMLADKDIAGTLELLCPQIDGWFLGEIDTPRAASSAFIQHQLEAFGNQTCYTYASIKMALEAALKVAKNDACVLIFGSFYTVAAALKFLQDNQ